MDEKAIESPAASLNHGNNNHISNPHVTVSLGEGTRTAMWILVGAFVVLFLTVHTANGARDQAQSAATKSDQAAYFAEQVAIACSNAGIKMPPDPFKIK